ncbi:D-isomer specific 2-hydroxyacid dehydrogenase family protein [Penicillium ucsense]|uniref:D-isomer specific 2-hydroxyacid dehydrogenase family protein n=1 Tax=Penicillium ucsense TaxID=2839758 RepID=A0A8J8W7G8_9EURO|nr:D-isomer specific 2-hydroxyacid dehydrogenase family protein [Penicillium ucsense]KAF7737319.1 D-isomer specific 2-hydroxyacid dehydrogenase family protein [Penicillium ucsense]
MSASRVSARLSLLESAISPRSHSDQIPSSIVKSSNMIASQSALLIGGITHARPEWEALSSILTLKEFPSGTRQEFIENCKAGHYDDVVAIYRSNTSNKFTGNFDAELLSILPKSIRYICHNGAGYDNIDVPAYTRRNIAVSSTPVAVNNATADVGIFLMIGALRQAYVPITAIREGKWQGQTTTGHDPQGKVLGILGMGGIGREMATRAKAFGMKIQYHNRSRLPADLEAGATYVSFDELLANSDVLSLNLALNASTRHIIGAPEFGKMKDGVVVVNTARGALIDEDALVTALDSGKVRSAGLDVYEEEPKVHPGLLSNPRVMLLPHIGTNTFETQKEMEILVLNNLKSAVEKGELITQVPEQKK